MRNRITPFVLAFLVGCGDGTDIETRAPLRAPIVNGTRAPQNTFLTPDEVLAIGYLAGLDGYEYCSGTLVTPNAVVTAEHCVFGESAQSILFGIGQDPRNPVGLFNVATLFEHAALDFALLILEEPATNAAPNLAPIAFNRDALSETWVDRWVDASGFGDTLTNETGRFFGSVQIYGFDASLVFVDGHGQQGLCFGDSGGPILWQPDAGTPPVVVGVESAGDDTCVGQEELTRLDVVAAWIDQRLNGTSACGTVTLAGECAGNSVEWCDGGILVGDDCEAAGTICGYLGDTGGYRCIPAECGSLDYYGRCDGTMLVWCEETGLQTQNCAESGDVCAWESADIGYNCVLDESGPITSGGTQPKSRRTDGGCSAVGAPSLGLLVGLACRRRRRHA